LLNPWNTTGFLFAALFSGAFVVAVTATVAVAAVGSIGQVASKVNARWTRVLIFEDTPSPLAMVGLLMM
jgi:hypothetical protein